MIDALAITEVGMKNDVERLRVVSNNLANASTVGFKAEIPYTRPFAEELAQLMSPTDDSPGVHLTRPVFSTALETSAGAVKVTNNPLDMALDGQGYFVVATDQGERYTRQGTFHLDPTGRLVTSEGHPVLGHSGEIQLTNNAPQIDKQGNIRENGKVIAQLRVANIEDSSQLIRQGEGLYSVAESTQIEENNSINVRQGFIETANVVPMKEMVRMIETVRHFETSQKILRSYDAMMDRAINVLGETR